MAEIIMVVGSLNRPLPPFSAARGEGLSVYAFDPATGTADLVSQETSLDNPSFLAADPRTGCIYAGSEVGGRYEGLVAAYRYDAAVRRLRYINAQPTLGSLTAHVSLDRAGKRLIATNYGGMPADEGPDRAVAVCGLRDDGGIEPPTSTVRLSGTGANPARQERSHPHCSLETPDGRFLVVADVIAHGVVMRLKPRGRSARLAV